jgi:hypothetical protein
MGHEVKSESRRERFQHWFRMFDANGDSMATSTRTTTS